MSRVCTLQHIRMRALWLLVVLTACREVGCVTPPRLHVGRRNFQLLAAAAIVPASAASAAASNYQVSRARRFSGAFDDKLHPLCERRVVVDDVVKKGVDGSSYFLAQFSGTDVGPPGIGNVVEIGCDEYNQERYKLREWEFEAQISVDGSTVDAGDNVHVGRWHSASEEQPWEGILWRDQNRWVRVPPTSE